MAALRAAPRSAAPSCRYPAFLRSCVPRLSFGLRPSPFAFRLSPFALSLLPSSRRSPSIPTPQTRRHATFVAERPALSLTKRSARIPFRGSRQARRHVGRLAASIDAASMARRCQDQINRGRKYLSQPPARRTRGAAARCLRRRIERGEHRSSGGGARSALRPLTRRRSPSIAPQARREFASAPPERGAQRSRVDRRDRAN